MSGTTITPVAQYDSVALVRSVAGERMMMDGGTEPLGTVLQKLADRAAFARDVGSQKIDWNQELSVDPGGSNSSFAVNVGAVGSVVLVDGSGVYAAFFAVATTIGASKIEGGGNLANSQFYYLYAWNNAGALDYELSLTAPGASRRTKSGDTTRRFLGTAFRTTSAGAPFPGRMTRGRYLYRRSGIASVTGALGSNGMRAVSNSTTVGVTSLDLSSRIPPHARVAVVRGEQTGTSTGTGGTATLNLYTAGDSTSVAVEIVANNAAASGDTSRSSETAEIELTSAQLMGYSTAKTTDLMAYTLDVWGWLE